MPNWVHIEIALTGDKVEEMIDTIRGEESIFDFEQIIPPSNKVVFPEFVVSPELVDGIGQVVKFTTDDGKKKTVPWNDETIEEYGLIHWYDWRCQNWGTKWNALDPSIENNNGSYTITFDTAWSYPQPIIDKLSIDFPSILFKVRWEEEQGFGEILEIQNGYSHQEYIWEEPELAEEYKGVPIYKSGHPDRQYDYFIYEYDNPHNNDINYYDESYKYFDEYFETLNDVKDYVDAYITN